MSLELAWEKLVNDVFIIARRYYSVRIPNACVNHIESTISSHFNFVYEEETEEAEGKGFNFCGKL